MYSEEMLSELRDRVLSRMSERRFTHTAEVEKMAMRIGQIYASDKLDILRAAALLHDVTKELTTEEHLEILRDNGEEITTLDRLSPKTLHARSAVWTIKSEFLDFADDEVLSCVRWHTTGRANMTLCEKIIYLADYIDMSRRFPDCVALREHFWNKQPDTLTDEERQIHLNETLVLSFEIGRAHV